MASGSECVVCVGVCVYVCVRAHACVCVHAEGGKKSKFRFFKPMNPIIRPLTAHFFAQNTLSLMKCPIGAEGEKKMLSTKKCCKVQIAGKHTGGPNQWKKRGKAVDTT